jgi:hypothetical protein
MATAPRPLHSVKNKEPIPALPVRPTTVGEEIILRSQQLILSPRSEVACLELAPSTEDALDVWKVGHSLAERSRERDPLCFGWV